MIFDTSDQSTHAVGPEKKPDRVRMRLQGTRCEGDADTDLAVQRLQNPERTYSSEEVKRELDLQP
ncbi:MAG: hypothetical protein SNJ52_01485 [Verrucomicrobiia bacterium]